MSGVTRHPTDAWVAQQLREATPVRPAPAVPHPRQRRQVRGGVRARRRRQRQHDPAHAAPCPASERGVRAVPRERAPRVPGPGACLRRVPSAPCAPRVRRLRQPGAPAPESRPSYARADFRSRAGARGTHTRGADPRRIAPCVSARRVRPTDAFLARTGRALHPARMTTGATTPGADRLLSGHKVATGSLYLRLWDTPG